MLMPRKPPKGFRKPHHPDRHGPAKGGLLLQVIDEWPPDGQFLNIESEQLPQVGMRPIVGIEALTPRALEFFQHGVSLRKHFSAVLPRPIALVIVSSRPLQRIRVRGSNRSQPESAIACPRGIYLKRLAF